MLAASFPKFGQPQFAWIALAPLLVSVSLRAKAPAYTAWAALRLGLLSGWVAFSGTLYWTVGTMTTYGGLSTPVAVGAAGLLVGYLSLYVGAFAAMVGATVRRFGVTGLWAAPCYWVALEWTRGWAGGGFPWVPLGSSQASVLPVAQLASVTGVYGLSWVVALVGTAAAVLALSRSREEQRRVVAVAVLLVSVVAAGAWRLRDNRLTRQGAAVRVGLVQGNIGQTQKWDPAYRDAIINRYLGLSRQALADGADVVVWPEASTPFFLDRDGALAQPIRDLAARARRPFVIGTDEVAGESVFNAATVIGADGRTRGSYRKVHLVPFGEYVPLKALLFFVGPLVEAVSDFAPGTEATVLDAGGALTAGVAICYESTYPTLSRAFVQRGAALLLVVTNDGWFGRSSAAFQHFEMGALRAIENGRYLARAANTGITAVVDPYGRVVARANMFEALTLGADVRLLGARTLYTRLGDVVAWLSATVTLLLAWRLRARA